MAPSGWLPLLVIAIGGASCGETRTANDAVETRDTEVAHPAGVVDAGASSRSSSQAPSSGDPRDLVSLSVLGEGQTRVTFDNYEQLRDYADVAALVRIEKVSVAQPFLDPYVLPGELDVSATVLQPLGGRLNVGSGSKLTFVLPLNANESQIARFGDRMDRLAGMGFALFAWRRVWSERPETYELNRRGAPNSVLAMWPGVGRLAAVEPNDFLAEDAVKRGQERTGTSSAPYPEWKPNFDGPSPIGADVHSLTRFANVGKERVEAPGGWDRLEPLLAPIR